MELISSFLGGLFGAIPGLVSDWIERRNAIRLQYVKDVVDQRRYAREVEQQRLLADVQAAAHYPLGAAGRVRRVLHRPGLPTILISPIPPGTWLSASAAHGRIHELLDEIEGFDSYAQAPSGAFVRDGEQLRFIEGEVGARSVALTEFGREPAVLIYFETSSEEITASAYLSTVFGSIGGDAGFRFVIARYSRTTLPNLPPVAELGGDLPAWQHIDLSALSEVSNVDIIAYTITWFILAVVDAYWLLQHGVEPGLLARTGVVIGSPSGPSRPAANGAATAPHPLRDTALLQDTRLLREANELAARGCVVTAEELEDDYVGLHAVRPGADVTFVLSPTYPTSPPVTIRANGSDIEIDPSAWSSECTLSDIVEAVQ